MNVTEITKVGRRRGESPRASAAARVQTGAARPKKRQKAASAAECTMLEQLPNIGPALARDLRSIGIEHPSDLAAHDGHALYHALCDKTGKRQDPCVLDTFLAATDFMRGAPAAKWWAYTVRRKREFEGIRAGSAASAVAADAAALTLQARHAMTKLEIATRERLDGDAFAFPKQRKMPLEDAAHVRNAIARFDQVEGVTDAERDAAWRRILAAAKRHGVEVSEKKGRHELGKPRD